MKSLGIAEMSVLFNLKMHDTLITTMLVVELQHGLNNFQVVQMDGSFYFQIVQLMEYKGKIFVFITVFQLAGMKNHYTIAPHITILVTTITILFI